MYILHWNQGYHGKHVIVKISNFKVKLTNMSGI